MSVKNEQGLSAGSIEVAQESLKSRKTFNPLGLRPREDKANDAQIDPGLANNSP